MKPIHRLSIILVISCFIVGVFSGGVLAATITGVINEDAQIEAEDGTIYEIGDTDKGNELADNYIGKKVEVTGEISNDGDIHYINVTDFKVIEQG